MKYHPEVARRMYERRMEGDRLVEVGRDYGVPESTVSAWVSRYVRSGAVELVAQSA